MLKRASFVTARFQFISSHIFQARSQIEQRLLAWSFRPSEWKNATSTNSSYVKFQPDIYVLY